jgi:TRAP-type transport system small permease protein
MMEKISRGIRFITTIASYVGFAMLIIMMLFLSCASILRSVGHPILGDIEVTSLLIVITIFMGIPFTQSIDGHIKIGILVDRLPMRFQKFTDIMSSFLTFCVASMIGIVYYQTAMRYLIENPKFTDLLNFPLYPFKFLIMLSAVLWALECIPTFINDIKSFLNKNQEVKEG